MKHTKKLFVLLLAVIMVMSLATTAFAADSDTYTITINNETDGHTYEAYQIFTGILSGEADSDEVDGTSAVLSNVQWGASVTNADALNTAGNTAAAVAEKLANDKMTVDQLLAMVELSATAYKTSTDKGDYYLIDGLEAGYYLVKDKDDSLSNTAHDAYTDFIMEVVENSVVSPKSDVPTVEKKIVEGEEKVDVNEAGVGEAVNYEITGTLPSNIGDYKEYYYEFTDTLSKGLTYNEDMKVYVVNGGEKVDVTKYFYIHASDYSKTNGTTITVAIQNLLALNNVEGITVDKDTKIVLEYSATVNEHAVIDGPNPNDVDLEYSNNPNDSGEGTTEPPKENPSKPEPTEPTGKTPKDKVETYVTEVHINKVDGKGNALEGAKFEITGTAVKTVIVYTEEFTEDPNGEYWKLKDGTYTTDDPNAEGMDKTKYEDTTTKYTVTVNKDVIVTSEDIKAEAFVGEDGKLTFSGLPAGEFTIKEIVTPEGYNSIDDINLKITFDPATKTFSYEWSGAVTGNTKSIDVVNQAGSTLPETGGMGTTIFYALGTVMVLCAVILLVTKRRMNMAE